MTRATVVGGDWACMSAVNTVMENGGNVVCRYKRTLSTKDGQVRGEGRVSARHHTSLHLSSALVT